MAGTVTRACRPGDRTRSGTGPATTRPPPRRGRGAAPRAPRGGHRAAVTAPVTRNTAAVTAGTRHPRAPDRQPPAASRHPRAASRASVRHPPPASLGPPPATRHPPASVRHPRAPLCHPPAPRLAPTSAAPPPARAGPGLRGRYPFLVPCIGRPAQLPSAPRPFRRTVNRWNRRATGPPVRPAGPSRPSGTARRGLSRAVVGGRDRPRGPAARELLHGRRGDGREEVDEVAVGVAQQQ